MIWILFSIWIITIIIYFSSLRHIFSKDVSIYMDSIWSAILLLVVGIIPIINIICLIIILVQYLEDDADIDGETLIRKVLCIKEEVDERWR